MTLDYSELKRLVIHQDHMDPRALGGWDHPDSIVGCCRKCNLRKKDMLFARWLRELKEPYAAFSRKLYINKHCYEPEDFVPIDDSDRIVSVRGDSCAVSEWNLVYYTSDDVVDEGWWWKEREYLTCRLPVCPAAVGGPS